MLSGREGLTSYLTANQLPSARVSLHFLPPKIFRQSCMICAGNGVPSPKASSLGRLFASSQPNNVFPTGASEVGDPAVGGVPNRYLGTPLPMMWRNSKCNFFLKVVSVEAGMLALRCDATEVNHEDFNEGIIQGQAEKKASLNYYA
nr:26S proteasome regulatory subunit 6A homolog [Tanacetum cinerariifolium]